MTSIRRPRGSQFDSKYLAFHPPRMDGGVLSKGAVLIRPFRPEDSRELYAAAWESKVALCAAMTWFRPDYTLRRAKIFVEQSATDWESAARYDFAIVDADDGTFCGSVGLSEIDRRHKLANVGFWVRRSRVGEGIATAAVQLVTNFGFEELGLVRLEFLIAKSNGASQRVAAKVGAKPEGTLRKRLILSGAAEDALLFSLLKEDSKQLNGATRRLRAR